MLILLFFWPGGSPRVRGLCLAYALAMSLTLVYTAEHYVADVIAGWAYAARRLPARRPGRAPPGAPAGSAAGWRRSPAAALGIGRPGRELGRPNTVCYLARVPSGTKMKTKKKCCKSGRAASAARRRCASSSAAASPTRTGKRTYVVSLDATKKDLKAARRR